jgi:hypothetical protein
LGRKYSNTHTAHFIVSFHGWLLLKYILLLKHNLYFKMEAVLKVRELKMGNALVRRTLLMNQVLMTIRTEQAALSLLNWSQKQECTGNGMTANFKAQQNPH